MSTIDRGEPLARVFFALVPPQSLQQALAELARDVARRAHGRPVPADNVHLTLAFIGACSPSRLSQLLDVGARAGGEAIAVTLDTLGGFRRAGVAWIGSSRPPAALRTLAAELGSALSTVGARTDERPLHPHLTLARKCRGPYPHDAVGPFTWNADHLALMRSETRGEGARYTTLRRWPLRATGG